MQSEHKVSANKKVYEVSGEDEAMHAEDVRRECFVGHVIAWPTVGGDEKLWKCKTLKRHFYVF